MPLDLPSSSTQGSIKDTGRTGTPYTKDRLRDERLSNILNIPISTDDQNTNMDVENDIEEGMQFLIDDVCSSELNFLDINTDVFNIKQLCCSPDNGNSVSDVSIDSEMNLQEKQLVNSSPASPVFYSDRFDNKPVNSFVDEVLGGNLPVGLINANLDFESKHSKDNISATQNFITPPNETYSTYDNFSMHQQPSNEAESRFCNSSGFSSNEENAVLTSQLHVSNPSPGNLIYPAFSSEPSLNQVDFFINDMKEESLDQLNVSEEKFDSLNVSFVRENGNILSHAIQDSGIDQDMGLNSRYIEEKVSSFLIRDDDDDDDDDDKFISTNKASESPERHNSLSNLKDVDHNSILESFESSFGKQDQIRVIKNVKIVFTSKKVDLLEKVLPDSLNEEPNSQASGMSVQVLLDDNYFNNVETSVAGSKFEPVATTSYAKELKSPELSSSHKGSKRCIRPPARYEYSVLQKQDSTGEEADMKVSFNHKIKKTKFSLQGLSDAEKYKRIREQNNLASKKCRENKKLKMKRLTKDHEDCKEINTRLKAEYAALERRVKMYKEICFQQNRS